MILGRITTFLAAGVLFSSSLFGQNRVSLGPNQFSIVPPEGFAPMAPDVRAKIFPDGSGPAFIFRHSAGDATASFDTLKHQYTKKDLPMVKAKSEEVISGDQRPVRWVAREVTKLQGRPCIHLEFVRNTGDGEIHEDRYYILEGKALSLLSFSSPDKDFAEYQEKFQRSRASIQFAR